jgi:hypothetical protein
MVLSPSQFLRLALEAEKLYRLGIIDNSQLKYIYL